MNENGFNHKTRRWQQKLFYKALQCAAVNIEILLSLKYPEFGNMSNTKRRIEMADALHAAAPCQKQRVRQPQDLAKRIKDAQKAMARKRMEVPAGVHALFDGRRKTCCATGCSKRARGFCRLCGRHVCFQDVA